jgi:hypothetical protein
MINTKITTSLTTRKNFDKNLFFIIEKELFNSIVVKSSLAIDSFNAHDSSIKDAKNDDVNIDSKFLLRNDLDLNYINRRDINTYVVYIHRSVFHFEDYALWKDIRLKFKSSITNHLISQIVHDWIVNRKFDYIHDY